MRCTATDFRKSLFVLLDRALQGETVEVSYKGAAVRITPLQPVSKLARAKKQDFFVGSDVLDDPTMLEQMRAEWEKDWTDL